MATPKKPDPQIEATKKKMRADLEGVTKSADILTGKVTPDGKVFNSKKNIKTSDSKKLIDIDDFIKEAQRGFTDTTPEKNDKPFNGTLGNVQIERLTKGTGKHST